MPQRRLTANERAEREYQRILQTLRNELKRDLERDSKKLLDTVRLQLTQELQKAFSQNLQQDASGASASGGNLFNTASSLTRIVSSILRLTAKPKTSSSSFESARSEDAFSQFRLSRGQSLADITSELGKGERNL